MKRIGMTIALAGALAASVLAGGCAYDRLTATMSNGDTVVHEQYRFLSDKPFTGFNLNSESKKPKAEAPEPKKDDLKRKDVMMHGTVFALACPEMMVDPSTRSPFPLEGK